MPEVSRLVQLLARSTRCAIVVASVAACGGASDGDGATDNANASANAHGGVDGGPGSAAANASDGAAVVDSNTPAAAPTLTSLSPSSASAGAHSLAVTLVGSGFAPRSTVQADGAVVASTFVDAAHLRIILPNGLLSIGGMVHLSVVTAAPGGGASAQVDFEVDNAAPAITSLAPLSATVGQGDVQLTVQGGGFSSGAFVALDGAPLATVVFSTSELAARIPSGIVAAAATHAVTVVSPSPGGGTSSSIAFSVTDVAATLTGVTPGRIFAGASDTLLSITGSGIVPMSSCLFNGTMVPATRIDSGHLQATIPAALLATSGDVPLSVVGPFDADPPSVPLMFHIDFGAPAIDSFDPGAIASGSGDTTVTIHGDGFASGVTVTLDGQSAPATFVDRTSITTVLPRALVATTHDVHVIVTTPAPGGGTSTAALLPVRGESPDLVAVSPSSVFAGSPATSVTLTGTSFLPSSVVDFDGDPLATTYVNGTTITALVPTSDLASPGTRTLLVDNGDVGTSDSVPFTIGCDTSGADAVLGSTGAATSFTIDWTNAGPAVTPITTTGAGVCPSSSGSGAAQPAASFIVVNATNSAASLEAWAVCGVGNAKNDAFLTMYNRSTDPSTDADRLACTGSIAEGASGYGGFSSPEANGAKYCPGLTLANSGALSLPACGRAVVLLQPWNATSTSYPPPTTLRVDLK